MMHEVPGAAFNSLDPLERSGILHALEVRKERYLAALGGAQVQTRVILLADAPGPGRPTDPNHHHTPFYSIRNSSLWLNSALFKEGIPEENLLWINTTLADRKALDPSIFYTQLKKQVMVICLGGNAEHWLCRMAMYGGSYMKVHHPQSWKRFHSKKPYPLLEHLKEALALGEASI